MIDTIKFRVSVDQNILTKFKKSAFEVKKTDNNLGSNQFNYFTRTVNIPSYSRGINIFHDVYTNNLLFELSLPKFYYGHNLLMINSSEAMRIVVNLWKVLKKEFGDFPSYELWLVTRIDLCYSWYLEHEKSVESLLGIIRTRNYPRKKRADYASSVYASSEYSTIKFYKKGEEFEKHDYKSLRRTNPSRATELFSLSKHILRFEVELRIRKLRKEFDTRVPTVYNIFVDDKIIKILNKYFANFMNNTTLSYNENIYKNSPVYKISFKSSESLCFL